MIVATGNETQASSITSAQFNTNTSQTRVYIEGDEKKGGYIASHCLQCVSNCGLRAFVKDGKVRYLEGNPLDPNSRGRMCAKGQAGVQQIYDPDRVKNPLERVGERGSGKWRDISWDEAMQKISSRLRRLRDSGHPEQFVFYSGRNMQAGYTTRFTNAFGSPNHFNHDSLCASGRQMATLLTYGDTWPQMDIENARYVLLFGFSAFDAGICFVPAAQRLVNALSKGAKLVVVDPRLSKTAAKASEWISIAPGTDAALAMGIMNVMVSEGLYDREFVEHWTVGFDDFVEKELKRFTPEYASSICRVPAEKIGELAWDFATTRPAVADAMRGVSAHTNGTVSIRAVMALNVLLGNIDDIGGMNLDFGWWNIGLGAVDPVPPAPKETRRLDRLGTSQYPLAAVPIQQQILPSIAERDPYPADTVMLYHSSPAYAMPDPKKQMNILKNPDKVPFIISVDPFMGESTTFADIVLPEGTYLERYDAVSWPYSLQFTPYVFLRKPVVPPQLESRMVKDILRELAHRIGGGMEQYFADDAVAYHRKEIEGITNGPSWDEIVKNGVWVAPAKRETQRFRKNGFFTPSGKIELYSKRMDDAGFPPFPTYVPVATHDAERRQQYPFCLITYKVAMHNQSRTANVPFLVEVMDRNYAEINPKSAASLGIRDGDEVYVESEIGRIEGVARLTNEIRQDTIAISHHFGHWEYGRVAKGRGISPNPIVACNDDGIGAPAAFNSTLVRVYKKLK